MVADTCGSEGMSCCGVREQGICLEPGLFCRRLTYPTLFVCATCGGAGDPPCGVLPLACDDFIEQPQLAKLRGAIVFRGEPFWHGSSFGTAVVFNLVSAVSKRRCRAVNSSYKRVRGRNHTARDESACTHTNPMQPASYRGSHTRRQ